MFKNKQTRQGKKGNCVETCIANLLEFPVECFPDLSDIPSNEGQKHFVGINKFLSHKFGCYLEYVRFEKGAFTYPRGVVLAIGSSSIVKGELHCVLWDYDNNYCVFDPSPSVGFNGECSLAGEPDAFGILVKRFEHKDEERENLQHATTAMLAPGTSPVAQTGVPASA